MHDDHDDLSREREIDKWMEQEPGPRERQPIPVMRDSSRAPTAGESLWALFDASTVVHSTIGVHESAVPGAEDALRRWALARDLVVFERLYETSPWLRTVHVDTDAKGSGIVVYASARAS